MLAMFLTNFEMLSGNKILFPIPTPRLHFTAWAYHDVANRV